MKFPTSVLMQIDELYDQNQDDPSYRQAIEDMCDLLGIEYNVTRSQLLKIYDLGIKEINTEE